VRLRAAICPEASSAQNGMAAAVEVVALDSLRHVSIHP
jgi:hypothetical protein